MTLAEPIAEPRREPTTMPTIWGFTPQQLHDRFWAAFGVQVVRRHERSEIVDGAELFLLCEPGTLVLFRLPPHLDTLYWQKPQLLLLRVQHVRRRKYSEVAVTEDDRLVRFERVYRDERVRAARVALTTDRALARQWQNALEDENPWRSLRRRIPRDKQVARRAEAHMYDERDEAQVAECLRDIMQRWKRPDMTVPRAEPHSEGVWTDTEVEIGPGCLFAGPVWVGAGRDVPAGTSIVGPAVLWDTPEARPPIENVCWQQIEPAEVGTAHVRNVRARDVPGKRAFDIVFACVALLMTLPLFPIVALLILLEDGGPVFFAHQRETLGGKEFPCWKFRSMKKEADAIKTAMASENQADGPQFFIADDPRVTRVGRIIRKLQIDELPQFVNVLLGHMSVVGPRPSPYSENQFCPPWREARLSVRPGITGLWQVRRTRREGLDFQEWIRFDLEYVESASWSLDLRIISDTVLLVLNGVLR